MVAVSEDVLEDVLEDIGGYIGGCGMYQWMYQWMSCHNIISLWLDLHLSYIQSFIYSVKLSKI